MIAVFIKRGNLDTGIHAQGKRSVEMKAENGVMATIQEMAKFASRPLESRRGKLV